MPSSFKTGHTPSNTTHTNTGPDVANSKHRLFATTTKIICTAHIENKPYMAEVQNFLMAYRVTPYTTTNIAPTDLMYRREIRYTIPDFNDKIDDT